jgi:hypothetical protein
VATTGMALPRLKGAAHVTTQRKKDLGLALDRAEPENLGPVSPDLASRAISMSRLAKKLGLYDLPANALKKIGDKGWLEVLETTYSSRDDGVGDPKTRALDNAVSIVGIQAQPLDVNAFFGNFFWIPPPILSGAGYELGPRLWRSFHEFEESEDGDDETNWFSSTWLWVSYWVSVSPSRSLRYLDGADLDGDYRPQTYWPEDGSSLPAYVKGSVRRWILEQALRANRQDALKEPLLVAESLDDDLRALWTYVHPVNMGGEFLPALDDGEVEIARIQLASVTADVASIRARRVGAGMQYRIVDEYEVDEVFYEAESNVPLDVAELYFLVVQQTGYLDEILERFEGQPEDALYFVSLTSTFYPQLDRYFDVWTTEELTDDEGDDGEELEEPEDE